MGYLIGTDEAGYGPNLGPLLIGATLWQVPGDPKCFDLCEALADCVTMEAAPGDAEFARGLLAMADSKLLYMPGGSLGLLELGLWSALAQTGPLPTDWCQTWDRLCPQAREQFESLSWYNGYAPTLPIVVDRGILDRAAAEFTRVLDRAGVRLLSVAAAAVFPPEFNRLLGSLGSKGELLSQHTLQLAASLINGLDDREDDDPVLMLCDKHGGRNRYQSHLQSQYPDVLVQCHGESRPLSVYRWQTGRRDVEVRFQTKCERYLPAALASMTAKYLRELAMRGFNAFWCEQLPGLRPTAGYPQDARRFKQDISAVQARLKIGDELLWRAR